MKKLAIAGTFDTKGTEFAYLKQLAYDLGLKPYMIHTGVFAPKFTPDVSNATIAAAAGYDIATLVDRQDRALATRALSQGMEKLLPQLYAAGEFDGIITCGGSGGTSLVAPAMRALPLGVPKVIVSTMASGDTSQYVGTSDIIMMPSIVDVAGLNKISTTIFKNAMLAIAGMLQLDATLPASKEKTKPLIGATMFGVTTPCVDYAKAYLEKQGYEVLVFHATGTGGKPMEHLIKQGFFAGILDLTTTEWCDEVCGGVLSAGPNRCEAAVASQTPQVVSVGACDMANFGPRATVPPRYQDRNLYQHNPTVTLMRTNEVESTQIGQELAQRWNQAQASMKVLLPTQGVSMIDAPGQPFESLSARAALFDAITGQLDNPLVTVEKVDHHINDQAFAEYAAQQLLQLIAAQAAKQAE
ncbi:Tm-1-like ATP-binding domain-containing protein [Ligilactobacillus saerimneri]|uniref:Tm-1-like ATP-binding domain-containing protein n=1 Tax=Ligilactobacillus saerimneri TaxID=228229 RepID=UPI0030D5D0E4